MQSSGNIQVAPNIRLARPVDARVWSRAAPALPLTYCATFLAVRAFVERRYGAGSFNVVRRGVRDVHDFALPPVIAPGSWHPTAAYTAAIDVARQRFGQSDAFLDELGFAQAEYEINMLFRFALKLATPEWLLMRGASAWRRAHNTGDWTMEAGPGWMRGKLEAFGVVHAGVCRVLIAWFQRACHMAGAPRARVWHPFCRARGDDCCVFEVDL